MQLLSLYIEEHKILKKFKIEFSKDFSLSDSLNVIIGENGSGKTTLIESLLRIFAALYDCSQVEDVAKVLKGKNESDFLFTLSYLIKAEKMLEATTTFSKTRADYLVVTVSNIETDWLKLEFADQAFLNKDVNNFLFKTQYSLIDLLPKNTVLYYAGFDSRLSDFAKTYTYNSLSDLYSESPKDIKRVESLNAPVFYFNPVQFNLLLFSLFCYEASDVSQFLLDKFKIKGFTDIRITFQRPGWHKGEPAESFWGSKGVLKAALDKFLGASQEKTFEKNEVTFSYFIPQPLIAMVGYDEISSFSREKDIFQSLIAFDSVGLLKSIDVTIVKDDNSESLEISSQDLSEGEKQLIAVYGLKRALSDDETLFLFDEPDTFLHPKWKREFIQDIYYYKDGTKRTYGDFDIITTHSPELVGNVDNKFVKLFKHGKVSLEELHVKGRDYNSILYDAFDTEKRVDYGKQLLNDFYSLLEAKNISAATQKLKEIMDEFGPDDIETQKAIDNLDDYN